MNVGVLLLWWQVELNCGKMLAMMNTARSTHYLED
jgi:hypothetical protein